jgi:2-methylisocitrate lyase-like PEP mutase family enzyme
MVDATSLPINADFEGGFGRDAAGVERSVRLALETGIAGLSIEDSTGDPAQPLRPTPEAVERVRAARRAIDATGGDAILVGRSEGFIAGRPDLEQTVARLRAYADAGADCLYAPGIATREQIVTIVEAVAPKPVNVLVAAAGGWTLASLAELGVRRVSVGGALARVAWAAFERAARLLADEGRFDGFADAASSRDLNSFFASAVQAGSD